MSSQIDSQIGLEPMLHELGVAILKMASGLQSKQTVWAMRKRQA